MHKKNLGDWGEKVAILKLKELGLQIIETKFFSKFGEIDIIAKDASTLVFIEVKTRKNNSMGEALESLTPQKVRRFKKSCSFYLLKNGYHEAETDLRFDFVALDQQEGGSWKFTYLKNAF